MAAERRFQLKLDGKRYDFSGETYDFLAQKTFKLIFPTNWREQKRVDGLEEKGLVVKTLSTSKSATYKRTELGTEVINAINKKSAKASKK